MLAELLRVSSTAGDQPISGQHPWASSSGVTCIGAIRWRVGKGREALGDRRDRIVIAVLLESAVAAFAQRGPSCVQVGPAEDFS